MKLFESVVVVICSVLLAGACAPLKLPVIEKKGSMEKFKYAYITPTKELTYSTGSAYGNKNMMYGSTETKSVNPSDIISGILIQNGYVILPDIKPELEEETLIVNYGETGRRNRGLGYTIEVTIQFVSAQTSEIICLCTAEGQGSTEADDIRQAITRALEGVFANK